MRLPRYHLTAALGLALVLHVPVAAAQGCTLRFDGGWARLPPIEMPVLGGFGVLHNPCDSDAVVSSASSPDFDSVEVHETRLVEGMMRMREVESLSVPAGEAVELAPGGLHLMLMGPARALSAGDRIELTFMMSDGTRATTQLEVR